MRKGPHPLPVHLGMVAANISGIHKYAANFTSQLSEADAIKMMRGIKMYKEHIFMPNKLPTVSIWNSGGISIEKPIIEGGIINPENEHSLLLVPSLINRANILDISLNKSMLRWFNKNGINTYILDWGDFTKDDEKDISINELIRDKLCSAIRYVSEINNMPVDVLGYCMGGDLLLPSYQFVGQYIRRMILLATPCDFHVAESELARNIRIWSGYTLPIIEEKGFLPAEFVQALFAGLDSNGSAQKFIKFANMDQTSSSAKLFVAVEDWLNDGVDLPKNIAQHCIQDWFVDNKIVKGDWYVDDISIDTNEIDCDILILASHLDRIVPFECAVSIKSCLRNANVDVIDLHCGHVGMIVGRNAIDTVWQPILGWLRKK